MIISKTPYRISFFGGGTDFEEYFKKYGGAVIGSAINRYCYVSVRLLPPFFKHKHRFVWSKIELINDLNKIIHPTTKVILKYFKIKHGLEIHYDGDLPGNSGIGSSSTFTAGLINALTTLNGKKIGKKKLAEKTIYIEKKKLYESGGYQDQIWASYGGFNFIKFNKDKSFIVKKININEEKKKQLNKKLIMFFVGKHRFSDTIEKDKQLELWKKIELYDELKKQAFECKRIFESKKNNLNYFGELLNETWNIKKKLSKKVTNNAINEIYKEGIKGGALGGKILGSGGGGFLMFYTNNKKKLKTRLNKLISVEFEIGSRGSEIIYQNEE